MKLILSLALLALTVYAGLCAYIYSIQRSLIYFPVPESDYPGVAALNIGANDETLKLWKLGSGASNAPAIIYFGGNAEDVALNIPNFSNWFGGYAVYLVNYRGYGGSTGQPTEQGMFADSLAIYDQLSTQHASVALMGRSLGSGVAVYLASKRKIQKLALITPFDSVEAVAQKLFSALPVKLLLQDKFLSVDRVKEISVPVLILAAEYDDVIPPVNTGNLAAAFPADQVELVVIKKAGHNDISSFPEFGRQLEAFF